jgi:hypothetical protein
MADPVTALTASAILVPRGFANASLAFQEFVKSGAGDLAKRFTGEAISLGERYANAKMDELQKKILVKLKGKPKAETAIAAFEQGSKIDLDR